MKTFKQFLLEVNNLEKKHLVLGNTYRNQIIDAIENDKLQLKSPPHPKIIVTNKKELVKSIRNAKTKDDLNKIFTHNGQNDYPIETKDGNLKLKDIDKSPFSGYGSGGKISGAEWEKIICVAWNTHFLKKGEEGAKEVAGITEWKPHFSNPDIQEAGISIVKAMDENGASDYKTKPMIHYGSGSEKVSTEWQGYYDQMRKHIVGWKKTDQPSGASRTSKTDMMLNGHKISAKKSGGSQLMSGGDFETLGTISVAMARIEKHEDFSDKVAGELRGHATNIANELKPKIDDANKKTGGGFVSRAFPTLYQTMSGKEGAQSKMNIDTKKGRGSRASLKKGTTDKDGFLKWVVDQTNMQDRVQESLESIISKGDIGKEFEKAMVHEAMTGQVKFGGGDASANWILKWTESGEGTEYHEIGDVDSDYVKKVTENTTFNVSFKTSGTGQSAWAALKLIFKESFEEIGGQYLTEQDILDEGLIWNFIKRWVKKVWNKIVKLAKKSLSKLMEIFGIKLHVDLKKNYAF